MRSNRIEALPIGEEVQDVQGLGFSHVLMVIIYFSSGVGLNLNLLCANHII